MILSYSPHEKTPTCFRTTELDSRAWWRPQGGAQGAQIRKRGEILWENSCEKMLIIGENMGKTWGHHWLKYQISSELELDIEVKYRKLDMFPTLNLW